MVSDDCELVIARTDQDVFVEAALGRGPVTFYDSGAPTDECPYCGALFFQGEARYVNCCRQGTIVVHQRDIPSALLSLITDSHVQSHIRQYNAAVAMASVGYSGDALGHNSQAAPGRPHVDGFGRGFHLLSLLSFNHFTGSLKISGRAYHLIGAMLPSEGQLPAWGQIFTLDATEATNLRMDTTRCAANLRPDILFQLHELLLQHNQWVSEFVAASDGTADEVSWSSDDVSMRSGIIAVCAAPGVRNIVVRRHTRSLTQISERHPLYFPLAYVLLWPAGGIGYSEAMMRRDPLSGSAIGKMHMLEWARYLIMRRHASSLLHLGGKLTLEFLCDVWSSVEGSNLSYLSTGAVQSHFRSSRFSTLMDQLHADGEQLNRVGAPVLLPASFTASPRWYHALYHDALALPAAFHLPDLFVTITFNPAWPELARMMPAHASVHDHPDVVARVFWLRFCRIMKDIITHAVFGEVLSYCYRIEWQLRGFPHAHVLLILRKRITSAADVDRFVSAEIPNPATHSELHQLVLQFQIHGPCSHGDHPCVVDGFCEKQFPKMLQSCTVMMNNAYPFYMRRGLHSAQVRGQTVNDAWVVPYNPWLLARHRSHINCEVASHLILYKYMYKYCFKPPDNCAIAFNEIAAYIAGRTLSSAEAVWRILGLPLHKEFPSVQRLTVHLPGHHAVVFDATAGAESANAVAASSTSSLLEWFALNARDTSARILLYKDIPKRYFWKKKLKQWVPRSKNLPKVARMHGVSVQNVELFMLRRLLLVVPGARSYEDLRTVDNVVYPTFEAAVRVRGMMEDDSEIVMAFHEVVLQTVSDSAVRRQFILYLVFCRPSEPVRFFQRFQLSLFPAGCDVACAWQELSCIAAEFRTSLKLLGLVPPSNINIVPIPLLQLFDIEESNRIADGLWAQLHVEQRDVAATILSAITAPRGTSSRVMMLQASGGCGKSFVCNYVAARVRSQGLAAVCVAASAQAAAVLLGGRTAHGQLRIPIECDSHSYLDLSVAQKQELASASVIIWDEASMVSDVTADCVNRSLQDILGNRVAFGGMPVVFCGDFRQLLPVVRGGRGDFHTIQNCSWWREVVMLKLFYNWRCQQQAWQSLLDDVGMGRLEKVAVEACSVRKTVDEVIAHVWPDAASCPTAQRAVLTLTLDDAATVNHHVINSLPGESTMVYSCDSYLDCKEPDLYPEEFVRSLSISGVAPGELELKVGARYIVMRNIDQRQGIVNGAQILCTAVTRHHVTGASCNLLSIMMAHSLAGTIMYGTYAGSRVMLPRITFIISPAQSHLPFAVLRRQFPLIPGFAYSVHRSQGSTLDVLGIYFGGDAFCHGLLFTALSRVRGDWTSIAVLSPDSQLCNCVNRHVLQCLERA